MKMDLNGNPIRMDPFFVVYVSRSGSTYLTNTLVRHPQIGVAPESDFVRELWQWSKNGKKKILTREQLVEVLDLLYTEAQFSTWQLPRENLLYHLLPGLPLEINEVARKIILMQCQRMYPNCLAWGLKRGGWYMRNIAVLRSLFPQAKFIHIIRDGRAAFASQKSATHSVTRSPFQTDPVQAALAWKTMLSTLDSWTNTDFTLEIRYEDLLTEPTHVIRKLLTFLGLNAETTVIAKMLEPHRTLYIPESHSHLHPNVGKPPQISRITAWREELSEDEVKMFERVAGQMLEKKGYTLMFSRSLWDEVYTVTREGMQLGTRVLNFLGIN